VFSSSDGLNEKIDYYLDHPGQRLAMTERAHKRCVPAYSLAARAEEIARILEDRKIV
jgi:spore maturation protein CgeB